MLPNIVQEHLKARGLLGTWGLYSPKLKAVPHPKLLKRLPLNALLPDVLPYPLAASILVSRLVSVKEDMSNALLRTPIDQSFPSEWR